MRFGSPRRGVQRGLSVLAVGALALGALVATPLAATAATVDVTDVTFDWAINNESGGKAPAPGSCNFLSAGTAGDAGSSRFWGPGDVGSLYKVEDGNTRIVKPTADGGIVAPTWQTKCTTPAGAAATMAVDSYSGNRVQISNGSGKVDVAANTAEIAWQGSFTVVYYTGLTYWTASNPKLVVSADGTGTLTASASGYGTEMQTDPNVPAKWIPLPARNITLATVKNVDVTSSGITVVPDYRGVSIDTSASGFTQDKTREWWGSFPQDFIDFQTLTGQSAYWFSSGGAVDAKKPAAPLNITYVAPVPVAITTQPAAQSVALGQQATFAVAADGATGYQWQSAAIGSDVWANVANATSATYAVTGTTATAKQYRVVVTGPGGPLTSAAATLTVAVPTPTVVVSKTAGLDPEGETITITGSGFLPNPPATSGARPPLAGQFTGAYVAFGRFAEVWKPSAGVGRDARLADPDSTRWGVHAAQLPTIGGPSAATLEIKPDGTFSTTFTVKKGYTGVPSTGNYGIYTYPGGGAAYPAFETYTPISFTVPVADAPAAPAVALGATDTSVDVSWTAPDDHDEPISGYDVTLTPVSGPASTLSVSADTLSTTFSGLVRGQSYTATVVAKNAGGSSAASPASSAIVIPAVAPSAPTEVVATAAGTTSVNVAWAAPATDGGSAITGYTVSVSKGGEVVATADASSTSATVTGLQVATEYSVTVVAKNTAGTSAPSTAASVTTLAEVPAALAAPTVTAASGTSINVQWVAPADGGSPITGYVVTVLGGSDGVKTVAVGAVTTTTVDGLQNGTNYTVTVAATNAQGTGTASPASAPARTFSAPSVPVVTAGLEGTSGIAATWSAPSDGGSAITGYTAQLKKDGVAVQTTAVAGTTVAFGSLTPGAAYTVSVTATNAVGTSAEGVSGSVTIPAVAPSAPGTPVLAAGTDGTSVTVSWTAPVSDGGSPILGYGVALVNSSDEIVARELGADARSAVFTGLAKGEYRALVVAANGVEGTSSTPSAVIELAGPAPAANPVAVPDSTFVAASGGDVDIAIEGRTVEIAVGAERANTWVGVTVHSDPVFLGWFLVDADGVVRATLPADLPEGVHHLVVQDADGNVIGYREFRVGAVPAGQGNARHVDGLAATGTDGELLGWSLFASVMLLMAGGAVLIARRRSARV